MTKGPGSQTWTTPAVDLPNDYFEYGKQQPKKGRNDMSGRNLKHIGTADAQKAAQRERQRQSSEAGDVNKKAAVRNTGPKSGSVDNHDPFRDMSQLEKTKHFEKQRKEGVERTREAVRRADAADPESQRAGRLYGDTTPKSQTERGRKARSFEQ